MRRLLILAEGLSYISLLVVFALVLCSIFYLEHVLRINNPLRD